jgi:formyltetrahydrofolate synthetase
MENFYEAGLILTAQMAFRKDTDVRDEVLRNIHLALQRALEGVASDNGFLISNTQVSVSVPPAQEN